MFDTLMLTYMLLPLQMEQWHPMWNMGSGMMSYGQGAVRPGVGRGEMGGRGRGGYGGPVMQPHLMPSAEFMTGSVPHPAPSLLAPTGGLTQPTLPYSAMEEQVSVCYCLRSAQLVHSS